MMILVPSDDAVSAVPTDVGSLRSLVAGHVIVKEGSIPEKNLRALRQGHRFVKVDLWGREIVFEKEEEHSAE